MIVNRGEFAPIKKPVDKAFNMKEYAPMNDDDFWNKIRHGTEKLGIPTSAFHIWKHRGKVSHKQAIPIYQALKGTEYEVSLDQIHSRQDLP